MKRPISQNGDSHPIRVMRVITQLSRGGVEAKLAVLLPLLKRRGFEVSVCCIKEAGSLAYRFEEAGIPVQVFPVRSRLHPIDLLRFARFIRHEQVDIVHTHMYAANITGTAAARLARVPAIISNVHNVGKFSSKRQVLQDRFFSRYRAATVCVSQEVMRDHLKATGVPEDKVTVIYNGVDTKQFRPMRDMLESPSHNCTDGQARKPALHPAIRNELGIREDERVLIAAGRLIPQKSPELLIEAFKAVHEEYTDTRLLLLGTGELADSLAAMSRELGVGERTIFAGYREDMADCLAASDIFVSSSIKEGFSNVLIEAMASGLPAVVTDVGGNREALRDGWEGFLCGQSAGELAARIKRILGDRNLHREMSLNARKRAMEFSLERMADQTADLYLDLISRRAGSDR